MTDFYPATAGVCGIPVGHAASGYWYFVNLLAAGRADTSCLTVYLQGHA